MDVQRGASRARLNLQHGFMRDIVSWLGPVVWPLWVAQHCCLTAGCCCWVLSGAAVGCCRVLRRRRLLSICIANDI